MHAFHPSETRGPAVLRRTFQSETMMRDSLHFAAAFGFPTWLAYIAPAKA
jgi:hypothetical protein